MKRIMIVLVVALFSYTGMTAQTDYEYTPLVREGVEWGYYNYNHYTEKDHYKDTHRVQFIGKTIIDEKIYTNAYAYTSCVLGEDADLAGWIREENKKVYFIINPDYKIDKHTFFHRPNVVAGVEYIIYDFTPEKVGDTVKLWGEELTVSGLSYIEINKKIHKQLMYTSSWIYPVVDGFGYMNDDGGNVIFPGSYVPSHGSSVSCLNYIRQIGGDYLYTRSDFNVYFVDPCLASVDGVSKDGLHITQSKDAITVEMPASEGASTVELVDIAGRVMQRSVAESGTAFTIITTELPKGAYIVIVSSTSGRYTQKVIIK